MEPVVTTMQTMAKQKASKRKKALIKYGWITFFVAPGLAIVAIFILLPLFMSLSNSMYSWTHMIREDFVGLENFRRLFTTFPFWDRLSNALGNNMRWLLSSMLIQNTLGLLFGYALSRQLRGGKLYRRLLFIPVLFSMVAVGFLWRLYLRPEGLLNAALIMFGQSDMTRAWLGDAQIATFSIIAVNIWRWVGFPSLVFMTACDAIDEEIVESAMLDGANEWQSFWKVLFPLMIPAVTVITVLTIIGSLNVFEQVFSMAGLEGPPNFSTDTLGTLFYRTAFGGVDSGAPVIGVGSAIAVLIYVATFAISLLSIWITRSKEVEM